MARPKMASRAPGAFRQPASFVLPDASGAVWLHAVSVGEVLSAVELLRRLRDDQPDAALYLSTGTSPAVR